MKNSIQIMFQVFNNNSKNKKKNVVKHFNKGSNSHDHWLHIPNAGLFYQRDTLAPHDSQR